MRNSTGQAVPKENIVNTFISEQRILSDLTVKMMQQTKRAISNYDGNYDLVVPEGLATEIGKSAHWLHLNLDEVLRYTSIEAERAGFERGKQMAHGPSYDEGYNAGYEDAREDLAPELD